VIVAIGEVIGDLLLGRVRVRNIGHEVRSDHHQHHKDDAAEGGQRSNCLTIVIPLLLQPESVAPKRG
jgi:hypothetical protein